MKKISGPQGGSHLDNLKNGTQRRKRRPHPLPFIHFLMVIASILVSTSFTVAAAITAELDPVVLTFVRFSLAACVFAPFIHYRYGFCFSLSIFLRSGLIGGCLAGFFCCMFWALRYTSALNTSVIFALVPSISGIYAFLLIGERLQKEQLLALACGIIGVVWVVFEGDLSQFLALQWNRGDLVFLGGCLALGLYTPMVKIVHREESMAVMTFWVLVTGSLWLFLFAGSRLTLVDWAVVPVFAWMGVAYLAVFTTIITFFLTQYSVSYLGPVRVTAYSYLYPGLVLIIDFLLGHDLPQPAVIPGVFVVLVAMFFLQNVKEKDSNFNGD